MRLYKSILIGLASLVSAAAFGQVEIDDMYFTRADRAKMKTAPVTVARPTALPTYEYDRAAVVTSAAASQSAASAGGRYANPDFRGNANVQGGESNYRYFDEGMGTAALYDDSYRPRYSNFNSRAADALSTRPVINVNNRFFGGSPFWGPAAIGWGAGWGMNSWAMNSWGMNPWGMNSFGWNDPWMMNSFGWGNPGFGWGMSSWGWNAGFGMGMNSFGWSRWNNCPPGMWGGGWYRPAATRVVVVNRPNPYEGRSNRAGVINNRPVSNSEQVYDANRRYPSRMRSYDTNVRSTSPTNQGGRSGSGSYNYYSPSNDTRRDSFRTNSGTSGSNNSSRDTFRSNSNTGGSNSSFGGRSVGGGSTGGGGGSRPAGRIR